MSIKTMTVYCTIFFISVKLVREDTLVDDTVLSFGTGCLQLSSDEKNFFALKQNDYLRISSKSLGRSGATV